MLQQRGRRQRRRRAGPLRGRPRQPAPGRGCSARRAWAAAPSVRSADALGWALHARRAPARRRSAGRGARWRSARATRLFLHHAGLIARGAGEPAGDACCGSRARAASRLAAGRREPAGGAAMRRLLLVAAVALLALAAPAAAARTRWATSRSTTSTVVRVSSDRVDVRYVLDQAEIPTFQERGLSHARRAGAQARGGARGGVTLTVGGRPVALRHAPGRRACRFPPGQGGLHTTRVELLLRARVAPARRVVRARRDVPRPRRLEGGPRRARPRDRGAQRRARAPTRRGGCASTRRALLASPADRRVAHLRVAPGAGTVRRAARRRGRDDAGPRRGRPLRRASSSARPPARACSCCCCSRRSAGARVHALSPGHGKAMVAAYLVARAAPRATPSRSGDRDGHAHDRRVRARGRWRSRCRPTCCPSTCTRG